ncbi:hypothetical protein APHAL10511_005220 [Amanita phalloides]|nr:hypothetical protein APHAL10511_005220 [Amanita phalloides]
MPGEDDKMERERKKRGADFVKGMPTLWDDVRFLSGESEAETEGFEADRAVWSSSVGSYEETTGWERVHGSGRTLERVRKRSARGSGCIDDIVDSTTTNTCLFTSSDDALGAVGKLLSFASTAWPSSMAFNVILLASRVSLSPGGSVKDRIAVAMMSGRKGWDASARQERHYRAYHLATRDWFAMVGAIKDTRSSSRCQQNVYGKGSYATSTGSEVVRHPTEAQMDSPESLIGVAKRLQRKPHTP